jgi:hypothetical protein
MAKQAGTAVLSELQTAIGRCLRAQYDLTQPIPEQLSELLRQFDKEQPALSCQASDGPHAERQNAASSSTDSRSPRRAGELLVVLGLTEGARALWVAGFRGLALGNPDYVRGACASQCG